MDLFHIHLYLGSIVQSLKDFMVAESWLDSTLFPQTACTAANLTSLQAACFVESKVQKDTVNFRI